MKKVLTLLVCSMLLTGCTTATADMKSETVKAEHPVLLSETITKEDISAEETETDVETEVEIETKTEVETENYDSIDILEKEPEDTIAEEPTEETEEEYQEEEPAVNIENCEHEYVYWYGTGGEEGECVEKVCIYCGYTIGHPLDAEDDPEFDMDELSYLIPEEEAEVDDIYQECDIEESTENETDCPHLNVADDICQDCGMDHISDITIEESTEEECLHEHVVNDICQDCGMDAINGREAAEKESKNAE